MAEGRHLLRAAREVLMDESSDGAFSEKFVPTRMPMGRRGRTVVGPLEVDVAFFLFLFLFFSRHHDRVHSGRCG